jgi:hypothetical protein
MGCGPPVTGQRQKSGVAGVHFSIPVCRAKHPTAGAGKLDVWKTENGDHIGCAIDRQEPAIKLTFISIN